MYARLLIFICTLINHINNSAICLLRDWTVNEDGIPHNRNRDCLQLFSKSDPLQQDGYKLSVLLKFRTNNTTIWRLGNLASREASIDYTALIIEPSSSRGYELSFGTSLAKVGLDGCKAFYV